MHLSITQMRPALYEWDLSDPVDGFSTVCGEGTASSIARCLEDAGKKFNVVRYEQRRTIDGFACKRSVALASEDFGGEPLTCEKIAERLVALVSVEQWKPY